MRSLLIIAFAALSVQHTLRHPAQGDDSVCHKGTTSTQKDERKDDFPLTNEDVLWEGGFGGVRMNLSDKAKAFLKEQPENLQEILRVNLVVKNREIISHVLLTQLYDPKWTLSRGQCVPSGPETVFDVVNVFEAKEVDCKYSMTPEGVLFETETGYLVNEQRQYIDFMGNVLTEKDDWSFWNGLPYTVSQDYKLACPSPYLAKVNAGKWRMHLGLLE